MPESAVVTAVDTAVENPVPNGCELHNRSAVDGPIGPEDTDLLIEPLILEMFEILYKMT